MKQLKLFLLVLWLMPLLAHSSPNPRISCGPTKSSFRASISSVQSGSWSDPATWGGTVPTAKDAPIINSNHVVTLDVNASVTGLQINGKLTFSQSQSATLQSTANIVVSGTLEMVSPNPSVVQLIRFTGINESNFVGGGMDPVSSDVGLWVIGSGKLNLQGTSKTSWTSAKSSIVSGSTSITVSDATGWQVGDEVIITATGTNATNSEVRKISNLFGNTVTLSSATTSHPMINNRWTAEVGNLTRNVRIEGTASGRSHVFVRSMVPQNVQNVGFRYLGPRKDQGGRTGSNLIIGRYGIHLHHCMSGSVGTLVAGNVMRDLGNHAYVPHMSDGITMRDNIAYNCEETPFWWDLNDVSNATTWVHNLVVNPFYEEGSLSIDTQGAPTFGVNGFILGVGDDNRCDSNVVCGQFGNQTTNAGYDWEEMNMESSWIFKGNIVHNSASGLRSWQNNEKIHVIENFIVYNDTTGVFHGAYVNNYIYRGGYMYNAPFIDHAASDISGVRIESTIIDGANMVRYPFYMTEGPTGKGLRPVLIRNCTIAGGTKGAIFDSSSTQQKNLDVIQSTINGAIKISNAVTSGETIRVQPISGQPYKITKAGTSNISAFAPTIWGTGTGLTAQYFNGSNFNSLAASRIEPAVSFPEWEANMALPGYPTGVHYKITSFNYSVRMIGTFEVQYNEPYKFTIGIGGGVRLWIDGNLVLNKWFEAYPTTYTTANINLTTGVRHTIKLEYFNNDDHSNLFLYWQSTTLKKELVPQTQLYPDNSIATARSIVNSTVQSQNPNVFVQTLISNSTFRIVSPENYKFEIFTLSGQRVQSGQLVSGSNTIGVSNLQVGAYVVSVNNKPYKVLKTK